MQSRAMSLFGRRTLDAEVCVVGGGPAGATCALRLAQLGHPVVLVERAPSGRAHVGESLPPSVLPLLAELGVREAVERAGFLRPRGALVRWAGGAHERAHGEPGGSGHQAPWGDPGFQVDRGRFDALLLAAAEQAGVCVLQPAQAGPARVGDSGVEVPLRDGRMVRASRLVLAHGRHGAAPVARPTAALYAYWRGVSAEDARTRVESGGDAWYWGAPLPEGVFNATVFVDARRCAGLGAGEREAWYRGLLAQSLLLKDDLRGATCGPVQVCDATPRLDAAPIAPRVVKVGEAAFSIDALSSQGVQAALRSAWQAASCIHTMSRHPARSALAMDFYREQVRRTAEQHARDTLRFHREAAAWHRSAFWVERALAEPPEPPVPRPAPLPGLDARVVLDAQAQWRGVAVLQGEFIDEAQALHHPALASPVAFVGAHPVGELMQAVQAPRPLWQVLEAWRTRLGDEGAVRWLAALWRQGVVGVAACD